MMYRYSKHATCANILHMHIFIHTLKSVQIKMIALKYCNKLLTKFVPIIV